MTYNVFGGTLNIAQLNSPILSQNTRLTDGQTDRQNSHC